MLDADEVLDLSLVDLLKILPPDSPFHETVDDRRSALRAAVAELHVSCGECDLERATVVSRTGSSFALVCRGCVEEASGGSGSSRGVQSSSSTTASPAAVVQPSSPSAAPVAGSLGSYQGTRSDCAHCHDTEVKAKVSDASGVVYYLCKPCAKRVQFERRTVTTCESCRRKGVADARVVGTDGVERWLCKQCVLAEQARARTSR